MLNPQDTDTCPKTHYIFFTTVLVQSARRNVSIHVVFVFISIYVTGIANVKQHTHTCYWSRWKCWFRRQTCGETSSRARSSSQSARTPPRQTISTVEWNGSRTCRRRPHKWRWRSKSIARLQANVFWHEYLVTIPSATAIAEPQQKKSPTLRFSWTSRKWRFSDESNWNDRVTSATTTLARWASPVTHVRSTLFMEPLFSSIAPHQSPTMGQLDCHLVRCELHQFPLAMWQE